MEVNWSSPEVREGLPLSIALPKGRLFDRILEFFQSYGLTVRFEGRKLVAEDELRRVRVIQVKNSDLPVYLDHGIAGLGICGEDVVTESGHEFFRLLKLPFGGTRMCLAALDETADIPTSGSVRVATKFVRFTRDHFHRQGSPVEVIALDGSVELAPVLGLAPYIVDLVETGSTLAANGLVVIEELAKIEVYLIANPAYYKLHYRAVDHLVDTLTEGANGARKL